MTFLSAPPTADRRPPTRGFTLLEMMVSLALVLVLMLAVTRIFSIAGQTVKASQALSDGTRDAKSAQTVFVRDLSAMAPDGPALTIYSAATYAYRSDTDRLGDQDANVTTIDGDGDGKETAAAADAVPFPEIGPRVHRGDTLGFFARDRYTRQTGPDGTYMSSFGSSEAYINYGHLRQPDNSGLYTSSRYPGEGTVTNNPNNFYASQWALGRSQILLVSPTSIPPGTLPAGNPFYSKDTGQTLSPLNFTLASTAASAGYAPTSSRFDLAGVTMAQFKADVLAASDPTLPGYSAAWFRPLIFNPSDDVNGVARPNLPARFFARQFVPRPFNSEGVAFTTPVFVTGCSQFIVEFAGDYFTQDANGKPLPGAAGTVPDGILDYAFLSISGTPTRQIRWYGYPRKTSTVNSTAILANNGDVVPVYSMAAAFYPFEKGGLPLTVNYDTDWSAAGLTADNYYATIWTPREQALRPKMLRITLAIDRPEANLRLPNGQVFEYVFTLP